MRPLITGATGLVGSNLAELLVAAGQEPVCLIRDGLPKTHYHESGTSKRCINVSGDLSDIRALERILVEHEVGVIYHLAAQTIVRYGELGPLTTFEANIRGTWNVLEAARRHKPIQRVVVASSDKAYGPQDPPYIESMPLAGVYPYDVSKSCADLIARSYHETYKLPVVIVRCSNLYGPGDLNWSRIIPRTIRYCLKGDVDLKIRAFGRMKRDYLHVADAVAAYAMVGDPGVDCDGHSYNFGSGNPVQTSEVVEHITRILKYEGPAPVQIMDDRNEITDQWMDTRHAHDHLGWEPQVRLVDGLTKTAEWYRGFLA